MTSWVEVLEQPAWVRPAHHDLATAVVLGLPGHDDGRVPSVRRLCLLGIFATAPFLLIRPAAMASCASGAGPEGSDIIFVGTAAENRRGYTRFAVSEVLAGPALAPDLWVQSGQEQPRWPLSLISGVSSSVDADFTVGDQYVVGTGDEFVTSACESEALRGGQQLQQLRRPNSGPVRPGGLEGADPPVDALRITLAVVTGIAGLLALWIARRRRRSTTQ